MGRNDLEEIELVRRGHLWEERDAGGRNIGIKDGAKNGAEDEETDCFEKTHCGKQYDAHKELQRVRRHEDGEAKKALHAASLPFPALGGSSAGCRGWLDCIFVLYLLQIVAVPARINIDSQKWESLLIDLSMNFVGKQNPAASAVRSFNIMRNIFRTTFLVLLLAICAASAPTQPPGLQWHPWSDAVFAQARQEHKFVLLDLEAVWCHWCHVMDDVTYRDATVVRLLNQKYILVKVDQDSRPDISNRYEDYGWPATVVFASDGSEIVKRQGYIPPRSMSSMLQAIIDDPSPGPSVEKEAAFRPASASQISGPTLARIQAEYEGQYDKPVAGWGFQSQVP